MHLTSSEWTNGVGLALSASDSKYVTQVLHELGVEPQYPANKLVVGLFKVNVASADTDAALMKYEQEVKLILQQALPLSFTANRLEIIKPWNTQLNSICWFALEPTNETREKLHAVLSQLHELLHPIMNEQNIQRNKLYAPHLTLLYHVDLVQDELEEHLQNTAGANFEEKLNTFLRSKKLLPHTFKLEQAVFHLAQDKRHRITF
jgi:hypothetical protein